MKLYIILQVFLCDLKQYFNPTGSENFRIGKGFQRLGLIFMSHVAYSTKLRQASALKVGKLLIDRKNPKSLGP